MRVTNIALIILSVASPTLTIEQRVLTQEQKVESATNIVIKYFELLCSKNVVGIEHLKQLQAATELINPISKTERDSSSTTFTYASQLDNLILKGKQYVNLSRVKDWADKKLVELEKAENTRKQVHEDTKEIHRPIRFVEILAGTYIDNINHKQFRIPEYIKIQETPVTQYQWAQVMGENPSKFVDGPDSEEIMINGKNIKMIADAPVCNLSYKLILSFIQKLNVQDNEYSYWLPSLKELQALLQITSCNGSPLTIKMDDSSRPLSSHSYYEISGKRIWLPISSLQQYTRDALELEDVGNQTDLVFGATTNQTDLTIANNIVHPIVYVDSQGASIGLRLVRCKKGDPYNIFTSMSYSKNQLSWTQKNLPEKSDWYWNNVAQKLLFKEDSLYWLISHKQALPLKAQHAINNLINSVEKILYHAALLSKKEQFSNALHLLFSQIGITGLYVADLNPDHVQFLMNLISLDLIQILDQKQKKIFSSYEADLKKLALNPPQQTTQIVTKRMLDGFWKIFKNSTPLIFASCYVTAIAWYFKCCCFRQRA